jgi:hypothetical protein
LPAIITGLGYTKPTIAQLFTVPPNMAAFLFVLGISFLSDRVRFRGPLMAVNCLVAIAGYAMLLAAKRSGPRYGGIFLVAIGVFPNSALIMVRIILVISSYECAANVDQGWMSNNLAPHYVRATGVGFLIAFANCSAFISSFIYLAKDAPEYVLGHSISLGALVLCLVTILLQIAYLRRENMKRARGDRNDRLGKGGDRRLGYRHPKFRYML